MSRTPAPVLIERTLLVREGAPDQAVVDRLVAFQRHGRRLLLIAPRPPRWRPTRSSVDEDLAIQQRLHQLFSRAGAEIDGIYYLPGRLFARRPEPIKEFADISNRYDCKISEMTMIGSDPDLVGAFGSIGGRAIRVGSDGDPDMPCFETLAGALAFLDERASAG